MKQPPKPWPNKPVYYWARWNGIKTLQQYTGKDHDHWSHIAWWRSRANERAYLWVPPPQPVTPAVVTRKPAGTVAPKYAGKLLKRSTRYNSQVKIWQGQARLIGYSSVKADGIFGPITESTVKRLQKKHRLGVDGIVGPKTWAATWKR